MIKRMLKWTNFHIIDYQWYNLSADW